MSAGTSLGVARLLWDDHRQSTSIGYGCRPEKRVATSGRSPSGLREELAADPHGIGNPGCGVDPTLGVIRAVRSS